MKYYLHGNCCISSSQSCTHTFIHVYKHTSCIVYYAKYAMQGHNKAFSPITYISKKKSRQSLVGTVLTNNSDILLINTALYKNVVNIWAEIAVKKL